MGNSIKEYMRVKKDWRRAKLKIALFFPSYLRISYSTLGFQIVYRILNSYEEIVAERFSMDLPYSIESRRSIKEFDMIVISSNYEMNYPNIASFVKASRFLEKGKEVLIGGITTYNPGPLLPLSSHIGLGDAEILLPKFLEGRVGDGLGIISSRDPVKTRALTCDKLESDYQRYQVLPREGDLKILMETSRGCPYRCKFCLYGNVRKRVAIRSYEKLLEDIEFWDKNYEGIKRLEIISSEPTLHPKINDVLDHALELGFSFSFPSLRLDKIDEELLKRIEGGGNKTITVAPENSERIREVLGKDFSNEDIYELGKLLKKFNGIKNVKMYFMTGIQGETERDLEEVKSIVKNFKELSGKKIKISINFLVPKAFAENFSELSLKNMKKLREKARIIKRLFNIHLNPNKAYVQGIFSVGGPEIGKILLENPKIGTNFSSWKKRIEGMGKDPLEDFWPYWDLVAL